MQRSSINPSQVQGKMCDRKSMRGSAKQHHEEAFLSSPAILKYPSLQGDVQEEVLGEEKSGVTLVVVHLGIYQLPT